MRNQQLLIVTGVVILVGTLGLGRAGAQPAARTKPTAIAVADIQKIYENSEERKQITLDFKTQLERLEAEKQDKVKKIKDLQEEVEKILPPGTPGYDAKVQEYERLSIEFQAWGTFQTNRMNRMQGVQLEAIYRKILDAIGKVAAQNGYDMVLFKEASVDFRSAKPENLPALITVRKVLWSAPELDLTDQVTQLMNNEYKLRAGAAPTPTPAPTPKQP